MLKLSLNNNDTYSEEKQKNPIRWKILYKQEDGVFTDQTGWIKCKDFFNDVVAYLKEGTVFSIYRFDNQIQKNDEGMYVLLNYIEDKPTFLSNMQVVNERLQEDLQCSIEVLDHEDDMVVVNIPNPLWESTYRISLATMVIRLSNYGYLYEDWHSLWKEGAPIHTMESAFSPEAIENVAEKGFLVAEPMQDFWWFCGKDFNSKKAPEQGGGLIHNNGVSDWTRWMRLAGV